MAGPGQRQTGSNWLSAPVTSGSRKPAPQASKRRPRRQQPSPMRHAGRQRQQQANQRRQQRRGNAVGQHGPESETPGPLADQAECGDQQQGRARCRKRPDDRGAGGDHQRPAGHQPEPAAQPAGGFGVRLAERCRQQDRQGTERRQADQPERIEMQMEKAQRLPVRRQGRNQQDGDQGQHQAAKRSAVPAPAGVRRSQGGTRPASDPVEQNGRQNEVNRSRRMQQPVWQPALHGGDRH